jgi:hypothetical protein
MAKGLRIVPERSWLRLSATAALLCAGLAGRAQVGALPPLPRDTGEEPLLIDHYPEKPTMQPAFTIPVAPLGFSPPGAVYLFRRQVMISLDFLDENRLLFSFRATGLIEREGGDDTDDKARRIRAVLLDLPEGKIESEAAWVVPDRARYVWMLKDGHFLLRDAGGLELGDATLKTAPFLHLPGRLLWLEMDPEQRVMITNSLEPGAVAQSSAQTNSSAIGPDATAPDGPKPGAQQTLVVRTMHRETGELIRITRVPWTAQNTDWPVNSDGYVESVKDMGAQWGLNLNSFSGGSRMVGRVESGCPPTSAFVSEGELLVTTCDPRGGGRLVAMPASGGGWLWDIKTAANTMWPLTVMAPDGSRFARETLVLKRPTTRYKRLLGADDLRGQLVRVMDAADGKVKLEAPVSPTLDGGGNVAISPSGRRVAILNDGAIEVFELPAPAKLHSVH